MFGGNDRLLLTNNLLGWRGVVKKIKRKRQHCLETNTEYESSDDEPLDAQGYFWALKSYVQERIQPHYPCYVMSSEQFEKAGQLLSHEELLKINALEDVLQLDKRRAYTIFISHEWLDVNHPDPRRIHYRAILSYIAMKMEEIEQQGRRTKLFLWIDYCCMPQESGEDKEMALQSLPYCISKTDMMVVMAPFYRHSSGRICDGDSFKKRGWILMEILARMCMLMENYPCFVTQDGSYPGEQFSMGSSFSWGRSSPSPLTCDFSCCTIGHKKMVEKKDAKEKGKFRSVDDTAGEDGGAAAGSSGDDKDNAIDKDKFQSQDGKRDKYQSQDSRMDSKESGAGEGSGNEHAKADSSGQGNSKNPRRYDSSKRKPSKEEAEVVFGQDGPPDEQQIARLTSRYLRVQETVECDRVRLAPVLVACYAATLHRALHLHGKAQSDKLALELKQRRDHLLPKEHCGTVLAEFDSLTGDNVVSALHFQAFLEATETGNIFGTRYNMSFDQIDHI